MTAIWSTGNATAADIQSALLPERALTDSTIRTVLSRLEEKGYLQHDIAGRTFVYSSAEPPSTLAAHAVKQIVDRFCHGSVESLLAGMVDAEVVDTTELQRMVDRLARQSPAKLAKPSKRKDRRK
jgi:BlaI family penicillinase repressor